MEIRTGLNKYFEIIGLLYSCSHPEFMREEMVKKSAAELGINAEDLYKKIGPAHDKYVSVFKKGMAKVNENVFKFFFEEEDDDFIISIQIICANHPEWFEKDLDETGEEEIILCFVKELFEEEEVITACPSFDEIIHLLEATGFSSTSCWKMMLFLQNPKDKIKGLADIIDGNILAYEKAVGGIQHHIEKLLKEFPNGKYLSRPLHEHTVLTPILVYPAAELVNLNHGRSSSFVGLYTAEVYQLLENTKTTKKNLLMVLRALSDSSKFEILISLMKSPKYNLELAEELNLAAATVSHHMNVLLTHQLVNVDKKDGRVYYTLSKETLKKITEELNTAFLLS